VYLIFTLECGKMDSIFAVPHNRNRGRPSTGRKTKVITTSIPAEIHADCKKKGIAWQRLIMEGYQSLTGNKEVRQLINDLQLQVDKLHRANGQYRRDLFATQEKLVEMEAKKNV
jgi:hypothetical protein